MKPAKFAPITAALLARKGEARPWTHGESGSEETPESALEFFTRHSSLFDQAVKEQADHPAPSPPPPLALAFPRTQGAIRKLTLRLSQSDYERLALIAAKRDVTRQKLLHQMLDQFLANAAEEFGAECGCISGTCKVHVQPNIS
ncbi:MAG TPA: hypothetical protein VKB67_15210 [Rhizomicrobium sp.]|nr:hypothetical protein [Rhizomicrobium sp.]